ncbi:MAG TPA: hypothetical protein VGX94_12095 [Terriglobia bacterium]|nr:hypothetical protein [Terriglobia bacterium]
MSIEHHDHGFAHRAAQRTGLILAALLLTSGAAQARKPVNPPISDAGVCGKNISFGIGTPSGIAPSVPNFARKWIRKNARKYPGLCFSQSVSPNAQNFLLVFSTSQSEFSGFYPTVRTYTSTNTAPVSGSGTVTDDYGGTWDFTFDGTMTTTTTTTTQENLPYTDTANTLYLYAYDQRGQLISHHSRTISTRSGGDGMNTLGYNVGAVLVALVDTRGRLIKDVVSDVYKAQEADANPLPEVNVQPPTLPPSDPAQAQITGTDCPSGMHKISTSYGSYCGAGAPANLDVSPASQATVNNPVPSARRAAEFPLTASVSSSELFAMDYLVEAQIGDTDYGLTGPRLDPGRYEARFAYPEANIETVQILNHDSNGKPVVLTFDIISEVAH